MNEIVITVVGSDRPGAVADVAGVLAGLGLNLTDSTMTLLRGHFAMTLVCAGDASADEVRAAIAPLCDGAELTALIRSVEPGPPSAVDGEPYTLVVHGADRLGIVAEVTSVLASAGGNITDLTTRLAGSLYMLTAEVDVPAGTDVGALAAQLTDVGTRLGVGVTFTSAEADML